MPSRPKRPKNYYQICGRPHAGLADPARFGLTLEQVVEIIEEGRWKSFYHNWYHRQKRKREREKREENDRENEGNGGRKRRSKRKRVKRYRCICCKRRFPMSYPNVELNEHTRICKTCVKSLQSITNENRDTNNS